MKKILFVLWLLPFTAFAQRYNAMTVHYYLPEGYSTRDIGHAQDPYEAFTPLRIYAIVADGYHVCYGGIKSADLPRSRNEYIAQLESALKSMTADKHYSYEPTLSDNKNSVYSYDGKKIELSSDYKKMTKWSGGNDAAKQRFYEINIDDVLP